MIYFVTWKVFKELLAMAVQCNLEQAPKVNDCKCKSSWLLCRRSSYVHCICTCTKHTHVTSAQWIIRSV